MIDLISEPSYTSGCSYRYDVNKADVQFGGRTQMWTRGILTHSDTGKKDKIFKKLQKSVAQNR